MVASGSRAAFRQPLQLRGGFKDFKVVRVVRDLNDSDNGKLLRSTFAIFFTEYSSYICNNNRVWQGLRDVPS